MTIKFAKYDEKMADPDFRNRVAAAAVKTAIAVMSENGATAGHAERASFAHQVLRNPVSCASDLGFGVLTIEACGTDTNSDPLKNDTALENALSSLWSAYSNYSPVPS